MGYLAAGVGAIGVAGAVALGIYLARMAASNRSDLHKLVQTVKDLASARRDIDGYRRNVEERGNAIAALQDQLARNRKAATVSRKLLEAAQKKLAARGDAASVAADINSTLDRLSEMSAMPGAKTGEGGDG